MTVSFSGNVKAEICRNIPQKRCCAAAMCFGILLFCNTFTDRCIRIITESQEFARFLPKLFKKAFSVDFDIHPEEISSGKMNFQLTDPRKIEAVMNTYGFDPKDTLSLHINLPVVENDCCKAS